MLKEKSMFICFMLGPSTLGVTGRAARTVTQTCGPRPGAGGGWGRHSRWERGSGSAQ